MICRYQLSGCEEETEDVYFKWTMDISYYKTYVITLFRLLISDAKLSAIQSGLYLYQYEIKNLLLNHSSKSYGRAEMLTGCTKVNHKLKYKNLNVAIASRNTTSQFIFLFIFFLEHPVSYTNLLATGKPIQQRSGIHLSRTCGAYPFAEAPEAIICRWAFALPPSISLAPFSSYTGDAINRCF